MGMGRDVDGDGALLGDVAVVVVVAMVVAVVDCIVIMSNAGFVP